ncbi:inter-alpha-trypsin inhibitor heavy chain H4 isoform X2 [Octopus bimaculoides]|uniref:inter-alpha-trypsin inhibitor heavy chain H4 isoform X2 n=1 Tax=Octopus bimaculoides TaxID=37653 RepID=UPI00071DC39C|nr:inter-alpha-trypsin inhibitor heavy chain H4 isoform X2 [Octopus bimaculoides]|eukprot:XP_014784809.1 PREDICTED: inter-alpha-trypsin inhibitor heavy chain H4-like isoform X2 [Octopus bimaculoides]
MAPRLLFVIFSTAFYLGITANEEPIHKPSLKSLHVISDIKYRFATTLISMKYYNPFNSSVSADLHVNMPRRSFISNFSMEIDGHVTVGEVKEKSVAKDIYENSVEKGQSAGSIEVKHRFANTFHISVNVEPQKYIVYNLTYQELLTRENNKYRHVIHLSNGEIIDDFLVEIFIREPQNIIDVLVPEITDDKLTDIAVDKELDSASIEYISSREVYIKYNPSRKQQQEISEKHGVAGLLRVEYDVNRQNNSNLIYAVDGYFVHFFTSDSMPNLPKYIIFMLDVSGSMYGPKIEQLKKAMENILDQLDPELDKFLIGNFSSDVSWMKEEFLMANNLNKELGKKYIKSLQDGGRTNINAALLQSIDKHKPALNPTKKSIIVFLTDGDPTEDVTNFEHIKKNVRESNQDISLFTLCFGGDCDSKFLRELATENGGFNRKIYLDADSKLQIENLYKEISNIVLKDITFVYLDVAVKTSSTSFSNYFKGSELVVSGVLPQEYRPTINVSFAMTNCWGFNNEILELKLYGDDFTIYDDRFSEDSSLTSIQSLSEITEKTYVYLTLKQLLMEDRKEEEVRHAILTLALKYNFVTPLTSMVVTKYKVNEELFEEEKSLPSLRPFGYYAPNIPHFSDPRTTVLDHLFQQPPSNRVPNTAPARELPPLPRSPVILIKPLNCSSKLCFTDNIQCRNQIEILLLADKQAGVDVYGYIKKASNINCLETLNRIRIKSSVYVDEIILDPKGRTNVPRLKAFIRTLTFSMTVYQYKITNDEISYSVHFNILRKISQAGGILGSYVNEFQCIEKNPNQMVLSDKAELYNKVSYHTGRGSLSHCFTI